MENREEYERLRKEWEGTSPVRIMAKVSLGEVCYNCGSDECIELHHIVPLIDGGTNNLSNIAVLCHKCHMAIHTGRHRMKYRNVSHNGRPHNVSNEEMEEAFDAMTNGEIGRAECKRMLGMSQKSKISDMSAYKKYLKDRGIKQVKNNIDILENKRGSVTPGMKIGYIEFKDGSLQDLYYQG